MEKVVSVCPSVCKTENTEGIPENLLEMYTEILICLYRPDKVPAFMKLKMELHSIKVRRQYGT